MLPDSLEPRAFLGPDSISYSELSKLALCENNWHLSYTGERPESPTSAAMSRGKEIHRLVQHFAMSEAAGTDAVLESEDEMADWLGKRYAEHYAGFDCVEAVEVPFAMKLPAPWDGHLFGWIDGLLCTSWKGEKSWHIWEIKSMARWDRLKQLPVDRQVSLYIIALRAAGIPVKGVMYDAIRTHKPARNPDAYPLEESFDRIWVERTDEELAEAWDELLSVLAVRRQIGQRPVWDWTGSGPARKPIKAIGSSCDWCFNKVPCFGLQIELLPE